MNNNNRRVVNHNYGVVNNNNVVSNHDGVMDNRHMVYDCRMMDHTMGLAESGNEEDAERQDSQEFFHHWHYILHPLALQAILFGCVNCPKIVGQIWIKHIFVRHGEIAFVTPILTP